MADVKTLKTRIALKIDTLENWGNSSIKLMPGEVAFATVAAGAGTGLTEPVIMAKIGTDEEKTFAELPWAFHAKASDVLAACKSEEGLRTFVNGVIADAGIASSDAMEALAGRVTTAEGKINTLVATDADKSAREIATEEAETAANAMKDAILGEGIKDTFDTLKEIQDWIEGDGVNATELTDALAGEAALRSEADEALGKRIDAIDNHSHANKELLDTYAQTEANLADAVAKKHSHSFTDADVEDAISKEHVHANSGILDNLTQDVIDNAHTHINKGVLDGITAEKVTAWDAAEQNAKDYADGAIASNNKTIMGSFSIVEENLTTEINKKANDADLAAIAKTGNVDDLVQTEGTYIIFDCGDSTVNA